MEYYYSYRNNLQRIENTVQEVQKTVERVVSKSRDVQSEIHAAVHKHIMALKQREVELINKVDQIKMVNSISINTRIVVTTNLTFNARTEVF